MSHKTLDCPDGVPAARLATIREALRELAGAELWSWVTFKSNGCPNVIEVAIDEHVLTVNIPHREKGGILPKIKNLGLNIPDSWSVKTDKKRTLVSSGYLEIEVGGGETDEVADFVERAGRELFGWRENDNLSASLQD